MGAVYDTTCSVVHGREVIVSWRYDEVSSPPWMYDGHGPVREGARHIGLYSDKRPHERPLSTDRADDRQFYYDWREATRLARIEGWCDDIDTFMRLTAKHKRTPTKGMVAEYAVQRDFEYLSRWCMDGWWWCSIAVTDLETGVEASLWGVESTDEHGYHEEVIDDLANGMWPQVCVALLKGEHAL